MERGISTTSTTTVINEECALNKPLQNLINNFTFVIIIFWEMIIIIVTTVETSNLTILLSFRRLKTQQVKGKQMSSQICMYINGSGFPSCKVKAMHEAKQTRVLIIIVEEQGIKIPYYEVGSQALNMGFN
jgi:heme/copper-type cytochrome/quinol oxidase subunit 2